MSKVNDPSAPAVGVRPAWEPSTTITDSQEIIIGRTLAVWDTRSFPNGVADIILTVNDQAGNVSAGTNTVLWTVADPSGNTNSCEQLVIVGDPSGSRGQSLIFDI